MRSDKVRPDTHSKPSEEKIINGLGDFGDLVSFLSDKLTGELLSTYRADSVILGVLVFTPSEFTMGKCPSCNIAI